MNESASEFEEDIAQARRDIREELVCLPAPQAERVWRKLDRLEFLIRQAERYVLHESPLTGD